ncbi:MAG: PEP-CTERM sorting domain-containing protein [Gammaproteobacteria bacterium]|nr:PEP-CTERM sorting domain-containing protein [Gammaproteobacteria bacterium]
MTIGFGEERKRNIFSGVLLAISLQFVALATFAAPIIYDNLDFQSDNQSMWAAGSAPGFSVNRFLGVEWNESATVGGITGSIVETTIPIPHPHLPSGFECHGFLCTSGHFHNSGGIHIHEIDGPSVDLRVGAEVTVNTSGKVGFQFGMSVDSGSVNTTVEFDATLLAPDPLTVAEGEFFNLNPTSTLAGGMLSTNFPELSVSLDAIVGVRASATARACLPPLGCTATLSTGELGFADQTVPIVSFNDPASPGQIKILGALDPTLFQFDSEINIPGAAPGSSLGGVTVHVPDINATGGVSGNKLTASGMDDLLKVTADLDGIALAPLGLPGLGVSFNAGILAMSFDLIDIDMGPILKVLQDFEFTPTLMVELAFDSKVQIAGFATPQTLWFGAWTSLPDIALIAKKTLVTPTFSIEGIFQNQTALGIDGIFQLDILKAAFALEAFGLSFDLGEIGPLFQILERTNLFNTPPIFDSSFALGGFNTVLGESFELVRIPEPGSLILLALGLIVLGLMQRGRPLHRS